MVIRRLSNSRFRQTPLINFDGEQTFGKWVDFLADLPFDIFIVTNDLAGRPDLISDTVYGTPDFFWAIISFNNERNPMNWPPAGDAIKIPVLSSIVSEL